MMFEQEFVLLLLLFGLVGWFWLDSMRAREAALGYCKRMCDKEGWEFLDQTVALKKLWPRRNQRGRMQMQREYSFEYSTNGTDRQIGLLVMHGATAKQLNMLSRSDFDEGTTFDE